MDKIMLYPSNWLYNAGVVGLLRVLESKAISTDNWLNSDGTVQRITMEQKVKNSLSNKNDSLPSPLTNLPHWHWNYVSNSFQWTYGSIDEFVLSNLNKAKNVQSSQRSSLRDQLQCKHFGYDGIQVNFDGINARIKEVWGETFGRKSSKTIDEANIEIVKSIQSKKEAYIYRKSIGYLFSKGGFYQNLFNPNKFNDLKEFIEFFDERTIFKNSTYSLNCTFCSEAKYEIEAIDAQFMSFLFPVFDKFPNASWGNKRSNITNICSFCKFIIIHHHLALTRLQDKSEILVNAPSFKVMYHLNKFVREIYTKQEAIDVKQLLGISVIEYVTKLQATLGVWTEMNIEVVSKHRDKIEFFSLPYEVIQLISSREVASALSSIGEFNILNLVLNQEYSKLVEVGYRLLRESLSAKANYDLINSWLFQNKNKKNNLNNTSNKILKLYALIEQKLKREVKV